VQKTGTTGTPLTPIKKTSGQQTIQVSPNPTKGEFTIIFSDKTEGETYRLKLIDLNGQVQYLIDNLLEDRVTIPANTLQKGMYLIQITTSHQKHRSKITLY
jgi:hypothetical protein